MQSSLQHSGLRPGQTAGACRQSKRASRSASVKVHAAAHVAGIRQEAVERGGSQHHLWALGTKPSLPIQPFASYRSRSTYSIIFCHVCMQALRGSRHDGTTAAGAVLPLLPLPASPPQARETRPNPSTQSLCPSRMCSRGSSAGRFTPWTKCSIGQRTVACWMCITTWMH